MSHNLASIKYSKFDRPSNSTKLKKVDLKVRKTAKKPTLSVAFKMSACLLILVVLLQITMYAYMAQRSYTMHQRQIELVKMREETQLLQSKIDELNSPKNINDAARGQSMVPSEQIGYINLKDATITGTN
ncbi:hypothetical protein HCQ94_01545 [Actinomyces sp. zg-332]|uniref:hypothetical protein n=1 Tax=Actinomyces sp. zg-332 TaxID=2708340 RepID=UPI001421035F|nr:hypothetical protein [Actinomyces sp. zg-332]QPK94420.1 hypothetical protein HCQ94_01545 [Actinomyces sp. zg-332]